MNTYLLAIETETGHEDVVCYTGDEMEELFTKAEQNALLDGEIVTRTYRLGTTAYVHMQVAAREVARKELEG